MRHYRLDRTHTGREDNAAPGGKEVKTVGRSWIREKKTVCGQNYMEIDILPITEQEHRAGRAKKEKPSSEAQKNLNDKRAKRYFIQKAETNFHAGDLRVDLTYNDTFRPDTVEEAEHRFELFRRKFVRWCKREGYPNPKWMCVTEYGENRRGKMVRIHHHLLLSGYIDREALESMWSTGRGKAARSLGIVKSVRLQPQDGTLLPLMHYLIKQAAGKRHWRSSLNLDEPRRPRPNDTKYTRAKLARLARGEVYDKEWWARQYPEWELVESEAEYNELSGWSVMARLRRRRPLPPPPWPQKQKGRVKKNGNQTGRSRTKRPPAG